MSHDSSSAIQVFYLKIVLVCAYTVIMHMVNISSVLSESNETNLNRLKINPDAKGSLIAFTQLHTTKFVLYVLLESII